MSNESINREELEALFPSITPLTEQEFETIKKAELELRKQTPQKPWTVIELDENGETCNSYEFFPKVRKP